MSSEREGEEVKRGRPLGPTSREESFSSRERARALAPSSRRESKSSDAGEEMSSALVSLDLAFLLALVTADLLFLEEKFRHSWSAAAGLTRWSW